jgi:chromosome partitioning protein
LLDYLASRNVCLERIKYSLERVSEARQIFNPSLQVDGIVFTMVRNNTVHNGIKDLVREEFNHVRIFSNEIRHLIAFQKAQIEQIPIRMYDKDSKLQNVMIPSVPNI